MKTPSHTPGPWKVVNHWITDKTGIITVAIVPTIQPIEVNTNTKLGDLSNPDNALLISAAPELLACLREVVFLTEGISGLDEQQTAAINAARAVIAKATI